MGEIALSQWLGVGPHMSGKIFRERHSDLRMRRAVIPVQADTQKASLTRRHEKNIETEKAQDSYK